MQYTAQNMIKSTKRCSTIILWFFQDVVLHLSAGNEWRDKAATAAAQKVRIIKVREGVNVQPELQRSVSQ